MTSNRYPVPTLGTRDFLEALAQNVATPMYNIPGLPKGGNGRWVIEAITCYTMENFGPEFNFFGTAAGETADVDTDTFLGRWGFAANQGERLSGAGLYRYYVDGLAIPYYDSDSLSGAVPLLHVILQNIAATAKSADAPGAIKAIFWLVQAVDVQG